MKNLSAKMCALHSRYKEGEPINYRNVLNLDFEKVSWIFRLEVGEGVLVPQIPYSEGLFLGVKKTIENLGEITHMEGDLFGLEWILFRMEGINIRNTAEEENLYKQF